MSNDNSKQSNPILDAIYGKPEESTTMAEYYSHIKPLTIDDLKNAALLLNGGEKTHYVFCHLNNLDETKYDLDQKGELIHCEVRPSKFFPEFNKEGKRHYAKVDKSKIFLGGKKYNPVSDLFKEREI